MLEVQRGQSSDLKLSSLEGPSLGLEPLPVAQEKLCVGSAHMPLLPELSAESGEKGVSMSFNFGERPVYQPREVEKMEPWKIHGEAKPGAALGARG